VRARVNTATPTPSGFVEGQVDLEPVQPLVDGVDQPDLPSQGVDGPKAAVDEAAGAVGDVVMDVAGGEQGFGAPRA